MYQPFLQFHIPMLFHPIYCKYYLSRQLDFSPMYLHYNLPLILISPRGLDMGLKKQRKLGKTFHYMLLSDKHYNSIFLLSPLLPLDLFLYLLCISDSTPFIQTTTTSTCMVSWWPPAQPILGGTLTILLSPRHIPGKAWSRAGTKVPSPDRENGP